MSDYECMICGSHEHVLREGKLCLCARCVEALGEALADKLEKQEPEILHRPMWKSFPAFPHNFCRIP